MDDQLNNAVANFAQAARNHYEYTLAGNTEATNRAAGEIDGCFRVVIAHGDAGRLMLLDLLADENRAVRSMAAAYSLTYAPGRVVPILEQLSNGNDLKALAAKNCLKQWREGNWHLGENT